MKHPCQSIAAMNNNATSQAPTCTTGTLPAADFTPEDLAAIEECQPDPSPTQPESAPAVCKEVRELERIAGLMEASDDPARQSAAAHLRGAAAVLSGDSAAMDAQGVTEMPVGALLAFDPDADGARLIGPKRYLCEGGSMMINGQAGIGKSSFIMQAAISWALGRDLFGIEAMRPLRVLIVQRENDLGDMAEEVQGVIRGLQLTAEEVERIGKNLFILQESTRSGADFAEWLERQIRELRSDFVFCDPLFAFCPTVEQKDLTPFLRLAIQPILNRTKAIICFVHHANKPPKDATFGSELSEAQKKYMGSGSMETTNWARAVLTIIPAVEEERIFELCAAKRGERAGMLDAGGNPAKSIYIRHAPDGVYWVRASAFEEARRAKAEEEAERKREKASKAERGALTDDSTPTIADLCEFMGGDEWAPGKLYKEAGRHFSRSPKHMERRVGVGLKDRSITKAPGKRGLLKVSFAKTA